MKALYTLLLIVLVSTPALAGDTIIRPNNSFGQPDYFQKGTVIESQGDGSYTIREEAFAGSGVANRLQRGSVATDNGDGSYTVRKELFTGSGVADPFDNGYTVESDDY